MAVVCSDTHFSSTPEINWQVNLHFSYKVINFNLHMFYDMTQRQQVCRIYLFNLLKNKTLGMLSNELNISNEKLISEQKLHRTQ